MKLHEAIIELVQAEEEFSAEDWKFLESYGKVAEIKATKQHEIEKMQKGLKAKQ